MIRLAFAAALLVSGTAATATTLTHQTFDTDPPIAGTQAPDTWYTDRFAPATFESESFLGDNRLALGLEEAEGAGNRSGSFSSAFYDTQGRKFGTPGALSLQIDMYIDPLWETLPDTQRVGGLWGTALNSTSQISFFPIIEFIGGTFAGWDGGAFQSLGLPTTFAYGEFATLGISLDTVDDEFDYLVNGELLASFGANGSTSLANAIVQGVNRPAETRTMYFDNFKASTETLSPIPVPAALPLMLAGLAALGLASRRRRRAA